jgi:hypothetical protein
LIQEKELAELHNKFRTATDHNEYQLRKKTAKNENQLKSEAARNESLLKFVEKLFDRKEKIEKKEGKEIKTVTISFRKDLLDEVKIIKKEWDKMMKDET